MKRLKQLGSWKRLGIQAGLLAGLGLAFVGTGEQEATAGGDLCDGEDECSFKKPNFMIIMDYSTSMNEVFEGNNTRWEVAVDAVNGVLDNDNGFFQENLHVGLMRFGHDPNPGAEGTTIPMDGSGITDGQSVDVNWYDPDNVDNEPWFECNGQAIKDALEAAGSPMNGNLVGIGTWTNGALLRFADIVAEAKADHPEDMGERFYGSLVVTDGAWTNPNGTGMNQVNNPAGTAADLFDDQEIPTYVVAIAADNALVALADELAAAGGTTEAITADDQDQLIDALADVVQDLKDNVIAPVCTSGLPRVMIILDASSSMLNKDNMPAPEGESGWDQARSALAGNMSLFDIETNNGLGTVEDLTHIGAIVFGHNVPPEEKVLADYNPCMKDNLAWALDPNTSCDMPGCDDPWGGPAIDWTFKDENSDDYPGFDAPTQSHMPQCSGNLAFCTGSGTYTHRGLELAASNQTAYAIQAGMDGAQYPADDGTQYINILITDGQYNTYSTDAQVENSLVGMYGDDITTYVIGFGDGLDSQAATDQLNNMACWGSGGNGLPCAGGNNMEAFKAGDEAQLAEALDSIIENVEFDPCCGFNDCSQVPEPTTNEPDPEIMGDGDGDGGEGEEGEDGDPTDTSNNDETGEGGGAEEGVDDGCNCSVDGSDNGRGALAALFGLGLLGLGRRRRKKSEV